MDQEAIELSWNGTVPLVSESHDELVPLVSNTQLKAVSVDKFSKDTKKAQG
jgi:hypothetical protein